MNWHLVFSQVLSYVIAGVVAAGPLLRMINGKVMPTKAVIVGLARELDSDVRYLEKLVAEMNST